MCLILFYLSLLSIVNCEQSKMSMGGVENSVSGFIHQTVEHTGVLANSVQPCGTLHQTTSIVNVPVQKVVHQPVIHTEYQPVQMVHTHVVPPAKVIQVPVLPKPPKIQFAPIELPKLQPLKVFPVPSPVLPPVMIPIIPKLPKVKPQFVEVLRPTLAPVVIPIPALPQVKPVAVLPPAPCVTYMEIPLPRPKPLKVPIIPKLQPIKYTEVELPAPAPLRIPVLPKPAPPKFVQIEMPVIAPVKLAPLPKIKPLVLPTLPKIELPVFKQMPVVYMPQPIPVHTIQTQVVPCAPAMPCPCSSCMQSYGPPARSYGYNLVPMHHGPYHNYPHQSYTGYQQSLQTSSYGGPTHYGTILPSGQHHYHNGQTLGYSQGVNHMASQRIQNLDVRTSEGTVITIPNFSSSTRS